MGKSKPMVLEDAGPSLMELSILWVGKVSSVHFWLGRQILQDSVKWDCDSL